MLAAGPCGCDDNRSMRRPDHADTQVMTLPSELIENLTPGPKTVRVFFVEHESGIAETLRGFISRQERARSRRYAESSDQIAVATSTGLLRLGLGVLLDQDPCSVEIFRDTLGRPHIQGVDRKLCDLNIARTRGASVLALSRGVRIGVDLERVEPDLVSRELIEELCGDQTEIDTIGFYDRWCSLEAVLKANGRGLRDGLRAAEPLADDRLWVCDGETWHIHPISTPEPFVCRVATCAVLPGTQIKTGTDGELISTRILCAPAESGSP